MSEAIKDLIRYFYEQLDRKNWDVYAELCAENFVSHFPGDYMLRTADDRKQMSQAFYEAFPDILHTFEEIISEGTIVVARFTIRATHEAEFMDIPATHRQVVWSATPFYRIENRKLAEEWINYDALGLVRQLGSNR